MHDDQEDEALLNTTLDRESPRLAVTVVHGNQTPPILSIFLCHYYCSVNLNNSSLHQILQSKRYIGNKLFLREGR